MSLCKHFAIFISAVTAISLLAQTPAAPAPAPAPTQTKPVPAAPAPTQAKPAPAAPAPEPAKPVKKESARLWIRSCRVYAAEISMTKPEFDGAKDGLSDLDEPSVSNPAWVVVDVWPGNRGLSRFDYVLSANGKTYPCLAVACGDVPFSLKQSSWTIEKCDPKLYYRMVFPVDSSLMQKDRELITMTIRYNLPGGKFPDMDLIIRTLPEKAPFMKISPKCKACYGWTYKELQNDAKPKQQPAPTPAKK